MRKKSTERLMAKLNLSLFELREHELAALLYRTNAVYTVGTWKGKGMCYVSLISTQTN